jgi:protein-tyrosine phosphatase
MGELLLDAYLSAHKETSIQIDSAGTRGLLNQPIDPSSAKILTEMGINSQNFRSKRLTKSLAESAQLILCFEKSQRTTIGTLAPKISQRTFLLTEFADICRLSVHGDFIQGATTGERLESVIAAAPLCRPALPEALEIEDPQCKDFDVFLHVEQQIKMALLTILSSVVVTTR